MAILLALVRAVARTVGRRLPWLVVDVETGGLDPTSDALLEIAAVFLPTGRKFHAFIQPADGLACNDRAIEINGLTPARLAECGATPEGVAIDAFCRWLRSLGPYLWCGANPKFDWGFVNAAIRRCGIEFKLDYHTVDIQSIAVYLHALGVIRLPERDGLPRMNVDSLVNALGVEDLRTDGVHGGDVDVVMEAEVLLRFLRG